MRHAARVASAVVAFSVPSQLTAQTPVPAVPPRVSTLAPWADEVWLALTDRDGSYYGRLADQGTFQRFHALMDTEYDLDLATGLFTAAEEARWAAAREGVRVAGASISHPFILSVGDWREAVPVSRRVYLLARYHRHHSLTTRRDYPWVAVEWRADSAGSWVARVGTGVHFFKPSADVELAVRRSWRGAAGEAVTVDLRVTALDAFSNTIFNALGVPAGQTPAHFSYDRRPIAARLAGEVARRRWRLELEGGVSTRSTVAVTFPSSGDPPYDLTERVGFAGLLAEARLTSGLVVSGFGTVARAATDRRYAAPASGDLRLRETSRTAGARARLALGPVLALEAEVSGLWRPEDRLTGDGVRVRHADRLSLLQVALTREPEVGWRWRLGYASADRSAGPLASWLSAVNRRHVMEGGYRFRSRFEVLAGLRWDLDKSTPDRFDGGHLRFGATW